MSPNKEMKLTSVERTGRSQLISSVRRTPKVRGRPSVADDQYFTDYSVWGPKFDLDAVLRLAKPIAKHSLWRRGDPGPLEGKAVTSGISMVVFSGRSEPGFHRAVRRFLVRERRFLAAVRRMARPGVWSGLGTSLFLPEDRDQPLGIDLPPETLQLLGVSGVRWRVGAFVCYKDGAPKLGGTSRRTRG